MIVFDLKCAPQGHVFEGWFGSGADYDSQQARGLVSCPICGSLEVAKAWAEKIPFVGDADLEIRQIAEMEHYAANDPDGKIAARQQKLREVIEAQAGDSTRFNTD